MSAVDPHPPDRPMQSNIVPLAFNSDFMRVCLFTLVQSALSVGAIVFVTSNGTWQAAAKQLGAIFCASMLTRISHASAANGTITAGKVV